MILILIEKLILKNYISLKQDDSFFNEVYLFTDSISAIDYFFFLEYLHFHTASELFRKLVLPYEKWTIF